MAPLVLAISTVPIKLHQGSSYSCIRPPHVYKKCRSFDNCTALAKENRQFAVPFMHPAIPLYRPPTNSTTMSSGIIPSVKMMLSGPAPMSYPLPSVLKSKLIDLFLGSPLHLQALFQVDIYNFPLTRERAEQLDVNATEVSRKTRCYVDMYTTTINDVRGIKNSRLFYISSCERHALGHRSVDGFVATEAYFSWARLTYLLYKAFAEVYFEECNKIGDAAEQLGRVSIATLRMDAETLEYEKRACEKKGFNSPVAAVSFLSDLHQR